MTGQVPALEPHERSSARIDGLWKRAPGGGERNGALLTWHTRRSTGFLKEFDDLPRQERVDRKVARVSHPPLAELGVDPAPPVAKDL
jgi:hypothetical protein